MNKPKIKIAFITPSMIIGGAETYIINKSEWLVANGFDVMVISEGGENVENLPLGVRHEVLPGISHSPLMFTKREYRFFIQHLQSILLDNDIEVIEAHNSYPAVHVAASYKQTKIPFCVNILLELAYLQNPVLTVLTKKINPFGLFYLLTHEMKHYIEKVINYKLNPNIIPIPVKPIRHDNLNPGDKYILSVSRLSEDKSYVKHLIQDFYELYQANEILSEYKLVIVGDGDLRGDINDLANTFNEKAENEIILLKGTLLGDDLETVYRNCTLFVGMGTTLLLAASCGKPSVIAGLTPETNRFAWGLWGENESDANIIGIGSANGRLQSSFKDTIKSIVESDDKRISAGNAAYKMFKENYDYDSIMSVWGNEYYRVIDTFGIKGGEIEKKLKNYSIWINFYREIRRVVKFFKP